ncbi:MAG: DUF4062 domain-containing protein [Bacteroidetes bacterium]|nr:DUF4062 domain-containing protein [Bacteroidota bacterium]
MKKIFVSSTYIDLIPHRKAIWELLKNFKLIVRGMEEFGARTTTPLETCIEFAYECDIYLGIIGMRYGSTDRKTKKSFTEIEYEVAYEKNKEIFIYLIDESESLILPKFIDFENYKKLEDFKKKLKQRHTIDYFRNPDELVLKVGKRLDQFIPKKNKKYNRPKKIKCKIFRFDINREGYIAVLGYDLGMPVEIYILKVSDFYLPPWIEDGLIVMVIGQNGKERYDLEFEDKDGYVINVPALNISRNEDRTINMLSQIITKLLKKETKIENIIEIIEELDIKGQEDITSLKQGIIMTLKGI